MSVKCILTGINDVGAEGKQPLICVSSNILSPSNIDDNTALSNINSFNRHPELGESVTIFDADTNTGIVRYGYGTVHSITTSMNMVAITLIKNIQISGEDGKSAYQYAVDGGYTGTEEEFQALMGTGPWLPMSGGTIIPDTFYSEKDNRAYISFGMAGKLSSGMVIAPKIEMRADKSLIATFKELALMRDDVEGKISIKVSNNSRVDPELSVLLYGIRTPTDNYHAANKKYVDDTIKSSLDDFAFNQMWGDETAIGDATWWANLKTWILAPTTTPTMRQKCVGKKKKVSLSTAVLGANAASMICIGADQDDANSGNLTFQTEGVLPTTTAFDKTYTITDINGTNVPHKTLSAMYYNPSTNEGSYVYFACQQFANNCSASASIKSVAKLTSSATGSRDNPADVSTIVKGWLPSEQEMGLNSYSPSRLECTSGTTNIGYTYYNSNSRRIKKIMDANGNATSSGTGYWSRSRSSGFDNCVCCVLSGGTASYNFYNYSCGLAPAFVIGSSENP